MSQPQKVQIHRHLQGPDLMHESLRILRAILGDVFVDTVITIHNTEDQPDRYIVSAPMAPYGTLQISIDCWIDGKGASVAPAGHVCLRVYLVQKEGRKVGFDRLIPEADGFIDVESFGKRHLLAGLMSMAHEVAPAPAKATVN